eukprot:6138950-Alexandrium_andersonii.AAC.1
MPQGVIDAIIQPQGPRGAQGTPPPCAGWTGAPAPPHTCRCPSLFGRKRLASGPRAPAQAASGG